MTDDLRTRIAWLLWCANEGYLTEADRAGVSNIFTADPATLHPDDAFSLPKWLGMADAVIRELGLRRESMTDGISPVDDPPALQGSP